MNHLFRSFITIFVFSILLSACDKEKEIVPSYLHISKFTLTAKPLTQGLGTFEIPSAKVFVNGMEIGNFELPVTLPVTTEGLVKIEIFPNVKENGLGNTQKYYKPYNYYSGEITLRKGGIDTIKPAITYKDSAKFRFIEDFENQGTKLEPSGTNIDDSFMIISTSTPGVDQPFAGSNFCGYLNMKTDSFGVFQRSTIETFSNLPNLGTDIYVELDIKTNINLQVGILVYDGTYWVPIPVMVAFPTNNKWKKFYVNLKPETGDLSAGSLVKIFVGCYKDDNDTEDKYVYIDNIKLLYVD
jgi:hypothetical protein